MSTTPWQPILSSPRPGATVIGRTLPQIAASIGWANGYGEVLSYNGKIGFVPSSQLKPYHSDLKPGSTCKVAGLRIDGSPVFSLHRDGFRHLAPCIAAAQTDPTLVNPDGVPAQIVPTYGEVGITWGGFPGGSSTTNGGEGGTPPSNTAVTNPGTDQLGSSSAVDAMLATDYGATAETVAQQQGVSVESVAAVAQAESGFRNVPTANGSSSATQLTRLAS